MYVVEQACMNVSMYNIIRGRTTHVLDWVYIRSHDMPNVLFLILIHGDIPFKTPLSIIGQFCVS